MKIHNGNVRKESSVNSAQPGKLPRVISALDPARWNRGGKGTVSTPKKKRKEPREKAIKGSAYMLDNSAGGGAGAEPRGDGADAGKGLDADSRDWGLAGSSDESEEGSDGKGEKSSENMSNQNVRRKIAQLEPKQPIDDQLRADIARRMIDRPNWQM